MTLMATTATVNVDHLAAHQGTYLYMRREPVETHPNASSSLESFER